MARQAGLRCSRVCCVLPALQRSKAQRGVCGERLPGLVVRGVLWHCEEIQCPETPHLSERSAKYPPQAQVRPTILSCGRARGAARQPMRSMRRGHAVAQLLSRHSLSLSSKAASNKKSLNLPQTSFPMHPNPALTEPPLLRRLSREHYEWQACQHRSNHQPCTCRHMRVLLLPGN